MNRAGFKTKAQSTLETTIALVAAVVLLLGITQVFVWLNTTVIKRQEAFRNSRTSRTPTPDFYTPEDFDIFGGQ